MGGYPAGGMGGGMGGYPAGGMGGGMVSDMTMDLTLPKKMFFVLVPLLT